MAADTWIEYIPGTSRPRPDEALAIVGRGKQLRLTPAAIRLLGDPSHVILLMDRAGGRIGIRTSSSEVRHSFPLKRYGGGKISTISAEGFFKWAGIRPDRRREFGVEQVDQHTIAVRLGEAGNGDGDFEEFVLKGAALAHQSPNLSISRNGNVTLNQPAMALIGSAERVVLLYNEARGLIGLRPTTDTPHARPLRRSANQRTWTLSAEGFLKRFGIPHEEGRSYEPRLDDGVLVVDLSRPKPSRLARGGAGAGNATGT